MFSHLNAVPPDPILQTLVAYRNDKRPEKIDLGVGIYRNEEGETPVFAAVKAAEKLLLAKENSKAYLGPLGLTAFNEGIIKLALGPSLFHSLEDKLAVIQTPGGCGALRVGAELLHRSYPGATLWLSRPTWGNHRPLLGRVGFDINEYRYIKELDGAPNEIDSNADSSKVDFEALLTDLKQAKRHDIVVLHASCHNPTGEDLNAQQWKRIAQLCHEQELIPFIDMAYQGFGDSLDGDAMGLRTVLSVCPNALVAVSCSKNFGLYRERTGALLVANNNADSARLVSAHLQQIVRGIYSMPPSHGAAVVNEILAEEELRQLWQAELEACRSRIIGLRSALAQSLKAITRHNRFDFVENAKGMFSLLGLSTSQVEELRMKHGVYMTDDSRVSIAGINDKNLPRLVHALSSVI